MTFKEKSDAMTIFAYEIAELICEKASNYSEVNSILDLVRLQLDIERDLAVPKLGNSARAITHRKVPVPKKEIPTLEQGN